MAISQKPVTGVSDIVYSLLTDGTDVIGGTPTYGTVYSLPNAIDVSFSPGSSMTTLYADNGPAISSETIGDMTISMGVADLEPEHVARLLGHTYSGGAIEYSVDDVSPYVALGCKVQLTDGAYGYVWYSKVKFSKPDESAKTRGASIEYQTPTIEGRPVKLTSTGVYRVKVRTDDALASSTLISNFFTAPVISATQDLGALSVTIAKATLNTSFTFAKVGGGNITLTQANLTSDTIPIYKLDTIVPGTYVITLNGTAAPVVTFTPTVAYGTNTVIAAVSAGEVYDQNGVYCTAASKSLTYP